MQIGCHGLVWTGAYDASGIRHAVKQTADAGFDLIEFPLMDPATFDAATARAALDEHGITASGSLGLSQATDISSGDPAAAQKGEKLLMQAVDVLAELGARHLCGIIYSAMQKYMHAATPEGIASSQAVIGRVADHAAKSGIQVSLEVTNRYESNVINTARQARDFAAQVDRPNLGIHLDSYHMNIEETDMVTPVIASREQLHYVHIGESHRGYLGTGNVDFDGLFSGLHYINYDGPIVFESFSSAVVSQDLTRMLGIWRNLWEDGPQLGAHANRYIRDRLLANSSIEQH